MPCAMFAETVAASLEALNSVKFYERASGLRPPKL